MTACEIAFSLSESQRGLLIDLCGCPNLFSGQYTYDGAGIEHLPGELWDAYYQGAAAVVGLSKARPSILGVAVCNELDRQP